jgi:hypothetical protein
MRIHFKALSLIVVALLMACFCGRSSAAIIFDDFNTNEGHFNQAPTFSGTSNVATTSTADRITTDVLEGAGSEQVVGNLGTVNPARIRFVSGSGTPANNVSFSVTGAATDGFIGYYYKTSNAGIKLSLSLDDSTNTAAGDDGGVQKTVVADGAWHLVEWDLDNPADWAVVTGIGGNGILEDGTRTIDSIFAYNITASSTILIDFVAKSDSGSIAALVPEPASLLIGTLFAAGAMLRPRRRA